MSSINKRLILSRIQTPDGTILTSHHTHDYVTYIDKNGDEYMLDGGLDYQRYNVNKEPFKDLSVYEDAPFEVIRQSFHRGGRGLNGNEELKYVPMNQMSNDWLKNCIMYNDKLGLSNGFANKLYKKELEYRKTNNITIED